MSNEQEIIANFKKEINLLEKTIILINEKVNSLNINYIRLEERIYNLEMLVNPIRNTH